MRELNTTVEQLSLSVGEIAEHATTLAMVVSDTKDDGDQVGGKMQETVTVSRQGKDDLQRVSSAMETIHVSMQKLQQSIDEVGKASVEITNITEIIGNIADQTSLLSLNASIEARAQAMQDEALPLWRQKSDSLPIPAPRRYIILRGLSARSTIWWETL